ncbi:MAG: TIGR00725 family protein [Candidatus Marinimicrobia bacterium]|nr:TIGR00725 family protein [Candidatus Neomarinimicrobiota bacterium]
MIISKDAPRVAIIGARNASPEGLEFAYEIGRLLGKLGALVYTGGSGGIMEAASRGVHEGGGLAIGILKESDLSGANEFIHVPVMTGMGDLRNGIIIRSVQGAIAVEGAYGTLSEIAYTLSDKKPVLGFRSWDIPGLQAIHTPQEAVDTLLELIKGQI